MTDHACKRDGESAISFPSNLSNTNIEVLETLVPVEVHERAIRRNSGGTGLRRGGDGITFDFSHRGDEPAAAVFLVNRLKSGAGGVLGGGEGAKATLSVNGEARDPAAHYILERGDRVVIETGGGGGFGTETDA